MLCLRVGVCGIVRTDEADIHSVLVVCYSCPGPANGCLPRARSRTADSRSRAVGCIRIPVQDDILYTIVTRWDLVRLTSTLLTAIPGSSAWEARVRSSARSPTACSTYFPSAPTGFPLSQRGLAMQALFSEIKGLEGKTNSIPPSPVAEQSRPEFDHVTQLTGVSAIPHIPLHFLTTTSIPPS